MLPRLNKDGRTQPYTEKHGDLRRKKTACFRAYTDSVFTDLEIQENVWYLNHVTLFSIFQIYYRSTIVRNGFMKTKPL